jgi:DNA (cytosine-5)-methyltransferase 1
LIGIRDDADNNFQFPREEHFTKRLKDVLENDVEDKYFLSEKMINFVLTTDFREAKPIDINNSFAPCVKVGGDVPCFDTNKLKIKSATSKGYEEAHEGDSINFSVPNSETRRGRVGKGVAQTLDTACNQGVMIGAFRGRNPNDPSDRSTGSITEQRLEINTNGTSNTLTSVQKDNVVVQNYKIRRLTPRECFRLMDFPDTFTWPVSDSQAYKQAGNSIVVNVLYKIIKNLKL